MSAQTAAPNPAPFSDAIIAELARLIPQEVPRGWTVFDPFAGGGNKLAELCDRLGYRFDGIDLEPWRGADPRVRVGNAMTRQDYPPGAGRAAGGPFAVVTSPTYNNGVNDHFKPRDDSARLTYRVAAGRELHPDNTGRYSGRGSATAEREYWRITQRAVGHWPDVALVNVKDSTRAGEPYPLVEMWETLLAEHGYYVMRRDVDTPSWRYGENHEAREDAEAVLIATR